MLIDGLRCGGKERQLFELLKRLSTNNIHFEVVSMNKDVHYEKFFSLDIKIHFLVRKYMFDPTVFFKLCKICRKFKPDIIHTWDSLTSFYVTPIAKLLNIKLILGSIRSAPDHIGLFSLLWLIRLITFPFSDRIVSNSYAGLRSYKVKNNSICIHNGFDQTRIQQCEEKDIVKRRFGINTNKVVGMVASFSDNKDYETYISAAKMILENRNDTTFLAIGDGVNLKKCKKNGFGFEGIIFMGLQNDIESIVNVFSVGVLSTYTEGISNAIMEYMALGKPVIATDGGGTKEIVIDCITGVLIEPKSPGLMAEKIEYLIDNREISEEMGEKGKKRIETQFSSEKMVKTYYDLYLGLL